MSSTKKMYEVSSDVLSKWMTKLFPDPSSGCINFGYWKGIKKPIDLKKRILSQKNLYFEMFKKIKFRKGKILEVGSGRGHGIFWLKELGFDPVGIDSLMPQIIASQKNYPSLYANFVQGYAEDIPFADISFDCIISLEAAQHFDFLVFCQKAFRVLKPNGQLILSTFFVPSQETFQELKKIIPPNAEGYHNAISIVEAMKFLKSSGFIFHQVPTKLGKNIFPMYSKWQKLQLGKVCLESLSEERLKHKEYYTGGGVGDHPWLIAFEKGLIDYYIIECYKNGK